MAKTKSTKKGSASNGSSHSNRSVGTRQISNVSSSSLSSASSPTDTTERVERRARGQGRARTRRDPVDLDQMAETMSEQNFALSPADTFDTVPLSESPSSRSLNSRTNRREHSDYLPVSLLNFDSPRNGAGNRKNESRVVIEHKIGDQKTRNSRSARSLPSMMFWIKPLLAILLLIALGTGASSIYGWLFKFPTLNKQVEALEQEVERLTAEIDRLESQVDRLEGENDRYQFLNDQLNGTVTDLEDVRDDLNGTVTDLSQTALFLNSTKDQLAQRVEELSRQNQDYAMLNKDLEENVDQLVDEIAFFEEALEGLALEHSILKNTTEALRQLAYEFSNNATIYTNETLAVLTSTLEGFVAENNRLESLNADLERGLVYLNQTLLQNGNLVESSAATLEEIASFLGDQVEQQQRSTLTQLEISYRQLLTGWDCDFYNVFDAADLQEPAASAVQLRQDVITYMDERVLSKLCLDPEDFLSFLYANTQSDLKTDQLVRATLLYTEEAMKYYFPSFVGNNGNDDTNGDDLAGIAASEWIDASFRCELLAPPSFSIYRNNLTVRRNLLRGRFMQN